MITVIIDTYEGVIVNEGTDQQMHKAMTFLMAVHGKNDLSGMNRFELVTGESIEQILEVTT